MLASRLIEGIFLQLGMLDPTSPAGEFILTMLIAIAEMERDLLVERTQLSLVCAKAGGKTLGFPSKTNDEQRMQITVGYPGGVSVPN